MRGLSIRNILFMSIIGISVIVIGLILTIMVREWNYYRSLAAIAEAEKVVASLSKATVELSLERSLTQVALNLDDPIAPQINDLLQGQREKSTVLFAETRASLSQSSIANRGELINRFDGYLAEITAIRSLVNPILNTGIGARSTDDIVNIPIMLKANVSSLNALGNDLRMLISDAPSDIRATDQIMQHAWAIREYGGRERTIYAIATARQDPISRDDLAYMLQNHGIALQAWNAITLLENNPKLDESVLQAVETVRQSYFDDYDALRKSLIDTSVEANYPVDFATLFGRSEEALQTAISLLNIAAESNNAKTNDYITNALAKLTFEGMIALIAICVLLFVSYFCLSKVLKPILMITDTMGRLAKGDNTTNVPFIDRHDEVGSMAQAVEVFRQNALRNDDLEREAVVRDARSKEEKEALLAKMAHDFETQMSSVMGDIQGQTEQLSETANGLNSSSNSSGSRSLSVADSSQNTVDKVTTLADSGRELSVTINQVASQVSETSHAMQTIVGEVSDAADSIESLKQASEQIGNVVSLIADIAGQTNLLALNATIEAARAGNAGKGFAVVASEVKNLSAQTEKATAQIEQEIQAIQNQTGNAVDNIQKIENSVQRADQVMTSIAKSVAEKSEVTSGLAEQMHEISENSNHINNEIAFLCQSSARSSGAAIRVLWSVSDLGMTRDKLQDGSDAFLNQLKKGSM